MAVAGVVIYAEDPDVDTYWLNLGLTGPLVALVLYGLHRALSVRVQWIAALVMAPLGPIAYLVWPNDQLWNYGALTVLPLLALAVERQDRRSMARGDGPDAAYGGLRRRPVGPAVGLDPRSGGPQAAPRLSLAQPEARRQRGSGVKRVGEPLGHRRPVLEAVSGATAHEPDGWMLWMGGGDEVRVRSDFVPAAARRREPRVLEGGEAVA